MPEISLPESQTEAIHAPRSMRTFIIIWLGELISMLGSGLTSFALGVWIYQRTGQATPFALTVLFGSLPRLLLLPMAGSLADRWNRRWLMILADTGSALVTVSVVFVLLTGDLQIWHIYLIAVFGSVFSAFQQPAFDSSVTMLVPKKDLTRANGMVQMGHALELVLTPMLAGVLFVAIGLQGIVWIDFITYFFAVGALLIVAIPQPEVQARGESKKHSVWSDAAFGWQYLRQRGGLFGLLWYFAMVNFMLNFAIVLIGPLVLSRFSAGVLGALQTAAGVGMLVGGILMSAWGGPKRRILGVIGFIGLGMLGLTTAGLQANPYLIGAGMFVLMFSLPFASGSSQAIFQTKVAPDIQGRVFAIRGLIAQSMMPLAFLISGPLADKVFEPLMSTGGGLSSTAIGSLFGTGVGRGIGLMFAISGLIGLFATILAFLNPHIRHVEDELPDAIPDSQA